MSDPCHPPVFFGELPRIGGTPGVQFELPFTYIGHPIAGFS